MVQWPSEREAYGGPPRRATPWSHFDVFISIRLSPQKTVSKGSTARMCWEIMINTPDALQLAHHLCISQSNFMIHPDTQLLVFMGTAFPLLHHSDLPRLGLISLFLQLLSNDNETPLSHSSWDSIWGMSDPEKCSLKATSFYWTWRNNSMVPSKP